MLHRVAPKPRTALALVLGLTARLSAQQADPEVPSPEIQAAEKDSSNGRFPDAKAKLAAILASPETRPIDRDRAGTELARIAWRIDDEPDAARTRLDALILGAEKKLPPLLLLSRMERSLGRWDAAATASRRAREAAETKGDHRSADVSLARALVEGPFGEARDGKAGAFAEDARKRVREALDLVAPIVHDEPGLLAASRAEAQAALLLDDGPRALEAWRSYYTAAGAADSTLLAGARAALADLLPRWTGPASARSDREALVRALSDSRFFAEAVAVARDPRVAAEARVDALPWVKDLVLYEAYARALEERTDRYYRDVARGRGDAKAWKRDLRARTEALWNGLSWPGPVPRFDRKVLDGAADGELARRFGTLIASGDTGGIPNLHMGHRVVDEKRVADQYGRHASIRFIALDAMVSNGFETWRWDGGGAHGGWGDVGLIVQVRPAYAEAALHDWLAFTEPDAREKADKKLAEETARDDERAAKDAVPYLPGLALRLARQGRQAVLDELRAKGLEGGALRAAFVAEVDRAVIESSIFAHEGRHAIDAEFEKSRTDVAGLTDGAAREYRAKLSEIAFASRPRLSFGGILTPGIGNGTPHGQANLTLVKGLTRWMDAHRAEIAGLVPGKPLLPQLDRLTDDQLRAAAHSLDPMASR
jgi:hypothetical protein